MLGLSRVVQGLRETDRTVAFSGEDILSSKEFVRRHGQYIKLLGYREGETWGLYLRCPFDFAACFLALLQVGKEPVILPNAQPGFLKMVSGDLDGVILDSSEEKIGQFATLGADQLPESPEFRSEPLQGDARFALFTSGSTGRPKKVAKNLLNIESELETLEMVWGTETAGAISLSTVSHQHIYGLLFQVLWPLCSGRAFDTRIYGYPSDLMERMDQFERTVLVSSPSHLARIAELVDLGARREVLQSVFSSGAPLARRHALRLRETLNQGVVEVLGSTETGGIAYRSQSPKPESGYWQPFPTVDVRREEDGGTLSVQSPYVAPNSWYRTEDRIDFIRGKLFQLLGRADRVVKVEGKRVSLDEIERRLEESDLVQQARALLLENSRTYIAVVLVPTDPGKELLSHRDGAGLKACLKNELVTYFERVVLPRKWRFVDQIPTNQLGKPTQESLELLFNPEQNSQPKVLSVTTSEFKVEMQLSVPPNLRYFEGHFPGHPVLPGIAQIDWATQFGIQYFKPEGEFCGLEAVKFHEFIKPEAKVELTLTYRPNKGKILFSFSGHNGKHSSGRLLFG